MKRRRTMTETLSHEFELDLVPLLAVMVKLVPVLIVSSAFVPVVIIQSELPAAVAAAVSDEKPQEKPQLELVINEQQGMDLKLSQAGNVINQTHYPYPTSAKELNDLKQGLVKAKRQYPDLFRLELLPQGNVPYDLIVKVIDAARKSPDAGEKFKFKTTQSSTLEETDYMYPDVVFANVLEE